MTTIKIPYNQSTFDMVIPWDSAEEPGIRPPSVYSIEIFRPDTGATVLAATEVAAADLATSFTLAADVASGDAVATLSANITTIANGAGLRIVDSDDGPAEDVTLISQDSSTKVATIERHFLDDHASGTAVWPMWTTYDLDTSDTDVFELGLELVVRVEYINGTVGSATPGNFTAQSYRAKIVKIGYVPTDLRPRFEAVYPAVYEIIEDRYDAIEEEAIDRISIWLEQKGRDINLITDSAILRPAILEEMYLLGAPRSDQWSTEREDAQNQLTTQLARLEELPIWFDEDQDDQQDDSEIGIGAWRPYMRGL